MAERKAYVMEGQPGTLSARVRARLPLTEALDRAAQLRNREQKDFTVWIFDQGKSDFVQVETPNG